MKINDFNISEVSMNVEYEGKEYRLWLCVLDDSYEVCDMNGDYIEDDEIKEEIIELVYQTISEMEYILAGRI